MEPVILYKKIYHFSILIIFITLLTVVFFLFINFSKNYIHLKDVVFFSSNLTSETIDYQKFEQVKSFEEIKKENQTKDIDNIRNPFEFANTSQNQEPSDESSQLTE